MIKKLTKICLLLLFLWYLGHITYITIDGLSDEGKSADVAIILGSKVNEDGTISERLEKRMECGLQLYEKNRVKKIIVSGGFGKEGFYEGDKMKEYLIKNGIPDSAIIVDNKGDNTLATVENTLKLQDNLQFKSAIVVSQYFHVTRTKKFFKDRNFENVTSACPHYFEVRDLYSIQREFVAYYYQ
ncbi:YdcF family protein [uncultured Flavobacterium sp.]|uniref:YdcF family protein n=1 Tax=uncultured Flavobacterium sp. TaxID=165435 RepID=UPI0025EC2214|nr:YdcF family protein [uncultured Flavobacterium sp.]